MKNIFKKIKEILKSKKFLVILIILLLFIVLVKDSLAQGALKFSELTPEQQKEVMSKLSSNPFSSLVSGISDFFTSALLKLPIAIAGIIADVGGFIISAEGKLLSWAIDIASFTKLGVVQQGWKICRDFANLFFIAILIYIAFATILRIQKVDAKKMLFKVITMAIIINFSLMIGGIIIDFSQVMFRYFIFAPLDSGNKDGIHFSEILMNAVGVQNIRNTSVPLEATSVLIRLIFVILFTFLCVIVFGALVITLLIRNFWLWILLILAPLAWFLSIVPVPMLSKYSSQWWSNFIKWCFMAPIMGFFIFLSVGILGSNTSNVSIDQLTKPIDKMESYYDGKIDKSVISFSESENSIFHPKMIIKFLIILSFLIAGLMAGQSLGSGAAKGALSMVNKAGKNTQKWMGRKVGTKAMQSAPARGVGNVLMGMGNLPLVGGALKRAGMATQGGVVKAQKDDLKGAEGRIKNLSEKQIQDNWKSFNKWEKQAAAKKLGNDKLSQEQFAEMQGIYSRAGMDKEKKDLDKAHPYWTDDFKKNAKTLSNNQSAMSKSEDIYKSAQEEEEKNRTDYEKFKSVYDAQTASGAASESGEATLKTMEANMLASQNKLNAAKKGLETVKDNFANAKANITSQFKEFNWSKSTNLTDSIVSNPDSAEFKAITITLAEAPFKEGLGRFLSKISVKNNIQETKRLRKITVLETLNNTIQGGDLKIAGRLIGNLNTSPSAMAGGYAGEDIFKELVKNKNITPENIKEMRKISKVTERRIEEAQEMKEEGLGGETKGENKGKESDETEGKKSEEKKS
jgi:hypothetical protein